jgi:hypothetical protein
MAESVIIGTRVNQIIVQDKHYTTKNYVEMEDQRDINEKFMIRSMNIPTTLKVMDRVTYNLRFTNMFASECIYSLKVVSDQGGHNYELLFCAATYCENTGTMKEIFVKLPQLTNFCRRSFVKFI